MVLKPNLACSQRPLQKESKRQLRELSLDECTDGLVGKGKDLLTFLLPLVILVGDRGNVIEGWKQLLKHSTDVETRHVKN